MTYSVWFVGWLEWRSGNRDAGLSGMRDGRARLAEAGLIYSVSLYETILAEAEAEAGETDAAVATIDRAIAQCERTGHRCVRGRKPSHSRRNPPQARSLQSRARRRSLPRRHRHRSTQQGAAASNCAPRCRWRSSTSRPAVPPKPTPSSRPRSKAFRRRRRCRRSPRRRRCWRRLAETDEVKSDAARRHRLTQLHAAYGNALIAARGHGAPETMEAFARARKSASGDEDAPGRFAADYGLWVGSFVRGDLPSMRTHAAAFLAGVAARPNSPEAGVAHRVLGTTHWFAGEYAEAREHLERALSSVPTRPGR